MVRPTVSASKTQKGRETKTNNKDTSKRVAIKPGDAQYGNVSHIPIGLQQSLVNVFRNSFPLPPPQGLTKSLQEVKQHLYNRDFHKAFGSEGYRETYALRWSPTRALGYLTIFQDLQQYLLATQDTSGPSQVPVPICPQNTENLSSGLVERSVENDRQGIQSPSTVAPFRVLCLGGGAGAEIVAFAGLLRQLEVARSSIVPESPDRPTQDSLLSDGTDLTRFKVTAVDIADWSVVVQALHRGITSTPPVPKYASASIKAASHSLVPAESFSVAFEQLDVLNLQPDEMNRLSKKTNLVTLMFTLNELYSTSMTKTTQLLLSLTAHLSCGTLLLVVDSPGSYSTVSLGGSSSTSNSSQEKKKYQMQCLLDHTLLRSAPKRDDKEVKENPQWEKLLADESRWFRLPEGLKYPLELEHMRSQIHLYRHL